MLAALLLGILLMYDLGGYPRPWFDEGIHLLVAKRLARTGDYRFGPALGPTVLYPLAGAFTLLGEGIWQGRLVIVGYGLLTLALGYLVARRATDRAAALLTLALWLSAPGMNFVGWSRQVLGEVPALAFFLAGVLFWNWSLNRSHTYQWSILGGLAFGLAILTKNQFALLIPAFILIWLIDRLYYHRARWGPMGVMFALILAVPLAWYALLPVVANAKVAQHTMEQWESAPERSIWIGDPALMLRSARFILGHRALLGLVLPAFLFALSCIRREEPNSLLRGFLVIFAAIWLGWYVFISIGWERYAFAGLALLAPFAAKMLLALWQRVRSSATLGPIMAVLVLVMVGVPLIVRVVGVLTAGDHTARQIAAYLRAYIPQGAMIETWEPEVAFLTEHRYHFPSSEILDAYSRTQAIKEEAPAYDPLIANPDYILIGEFGWWTELYSQKFLKVCCKPVKTVGTYALFEVISHAAPSTGGKEEAPWQTRLPLNPIDQ
jgi:4-amino-4-deoxy-L-arabinose transferase-like glycosyltransferase